MHNAATELTSQCIFGDAMLAQSTISGRNNTTQFDPEKMAYLKSIIQGRAKMDSIHFEEVWVKCLESLKS